MSVTGPVRYLVIGNSTYEIYNTDTKVTQTASASSSYTYWRPLIIGYSSGSTAVTAPTTQTNTTYTFSTLMVQPSSGTIRFGTAALYNGDYTVSLTPDTLTAARSITIPDKNGTMALTSDIPAAYELPIASSSTLGGIKVGTNLSINSSTGVLSANFTETDPVFSASAAAGIQSSDITNWNSKTSNTGTVTSVQVQASAPLSSSTSTAQSTSLNTTISIANQNSNLVLAGPTSGNAAAPTFRSLVAADIPNLNYVPISSTFIESDITYTLEISNIEAFLSIQAFTQEENNDPVLASQIEVGASIGLYTINPEEDINGGFWSENGNAELYGVNVYIGGDNVYVQGMTTGASIDSSNLITFTDADDNTTFTLQLPSGGGGPVDADIDLSGLISFYDSNEQVIFTLQLPIYTGGVS